MKKFLWCVSLIAVIAVGAKSKTDKQDDGSISSGKDLFMAKACFVCHQTDPKIPTPAGEALKAPTFINKFWGTEREVHIGPNGPIEKVTFNLEYFLESVEKPMAKIVKGSLPAMAPLPTTIEERRALAAYVKSLSK